MGLNWSDFAPPHGDMDISRDIFVVMTRSGEEATGIWGGRGQGCCRTFHHAQDSLTTELSGFRC